MWCILPNEVEQEVAEQGQMVETGFSKERSELARLIFEMGVLGHLPNACLRTIDCKGFRGWPRWIGKRSTADGIGPACERMPLTGLTDEWHTIKASANLWSGQREWDGCTFVSACATLSTDSCITCAADSTMDGVGKRSALGRGIGCQDAPEAASNSLQVRRGVFDNGCDRH